MKISKRKFTIFGISFILAAVAFNIFLNSIYSLPVLMYHSIDYTNDRKDKMVVSPEAFERQMKFLHDGSYNVVPLEKAVEYIKTGKKPPHKTLAITMDDGYYNNYQHAYPVLKKYNIPAAI